MTEKVIEQLSAWKEEGRELPVVSVNYSARQLSDTDYTAFLRDCLARYDIPADRIKIEITESSVFSDKERSDAFFDEIHAMGMAIALDDFGTGYSSISSMTSLPVDFIKFDKSLTDTYLTGDRVAFLANLTSIVHDAGRRVIIEGVETEDQFALAKAIGIDEIQGYFFDRPLPAEEAIRVSYE